MANDFGISLGYIGLQKYFRDTAEIENRSLSTFNKVDKSTSRVSEGFSDMARRLPIVGQAFEFITNPIGAVITGLTAATAAAKSFIQTTASFEQEIANVRAIVDPLGQSQTAFQAINAEAQRLGETTEFSARQAAQAMEFLARAGFNTQQILEGTADTLSLATVGSLDLGRASDIATDTLSQFNLQAADLGKVVDIIGKTTTSSNSNVSQFADAMQYLGATAAALGIPLEEASAAIGVLANNGLKGSLGTRALGTSLVRLSKPTAEAKELLEALNINAFDSQGNFVGLANLIGELEKGFKGLSQQQRQAAIATIFGAEAIQEINILFKNGQQNLKNYTAQIKEAGDQGGEFSKKLRETKLDTFNGALIQLKSAFEALQIALSEGIIDNLKDFVIGLTSATRAAVAYVREAGGITGVIRDNADVLTLAATAIVAYNAGTIALAVSSARAFIIEQSLSIARAATATATNLAISAQALYITGTNLLTGRITLATAAQRAFNVVFRQNPIGLAVTVIGLAAAAYFNLSKGLKSSNEAYRINDNVRKGVIQSVAQEIGALQKLFGPLNDDTANRERKNRAVREINERYGPLLKNLGIEKVTVENAADAYERLTRAIIRNIVVEQQKQILSDILKDQVDLQIKLNAETNKIASFDKQRIDLLNEQNNLLGANSSEARGIELGARNATIAAEAYSAQLEDNRRKIQEVSGAFKGLEQDIINGIGDIDLTLLAPDQAEIDGVVNDIQDKLDKKKVNIKYELTKVGEVDIPEVDLFQDPAELAKVDLPDAEFRDFFDLIEEGIGKLNKLGVVSGDTFSVLASGIETAFNAMNNVIGTFGDTLERVSAETQSFGQALTQTFLLVTTDLLEQGLRWAGLAALRIAATANGLDPYTRLALLAGGATALQYSLFAEIANKVAGIAFDNSNSTASQTSLGGQNNVNSSLVTQGFQSQPGAQQGLSTLGTSTPDPVVNVRVMIGNEDVTEWINTQTIIRRERR